MLEEIVSILFSFFPSPLLKQLEREGLEDSLDAGKTSKENEEASVSL